MATLDDIRDDYDDNVDNLSKADIKDLMNIIVRKKEEGSLDDPTKYDQLTTVPYFHAYMRTGSSLNVVQACALDEANETIFTLWRDTLQGRVAKTNVNAMLGTELRNLLENASNLKITEDEVHRVRTLHHADPKNITIRPCKNYQTKGTCYHDSKCIFLHCS